MHHHGTWERGADRLIPFPARPSKVIPVDRGRIRDIPAARVQQSAVLGDFADNTCIEYILLLSLMIVVTDRVTFSAELTTRL